MDTTNGFGPEPESSAGGPTPLQCGLLARAHAVAEQITMRVLKVLEDTRPNREPPGSGDNPPSFA